MDKVLGFFKTSIGKYLLIALALIVIVIIARKQWEKIKYNGLTKSGVISAVAEHYGMARLKSHLWELEGNKWSSANSMAAWYDEFVPPHIEDAQVKEALKSLGVDYVKHPEILNIKSEVNGIANMSNFT